jgi:hypothetical protein
MSHWADMLAAMHTIYLWHHTDERTGRRRRTRYRMDEAQAKQRLIDPQRIDESAMVVTPVTVMPSGHWRCGLVMNENGAMVPATSSADQAKPTKPLRP